MPNRILKESIRYSEKLNGLTDWQYRVWVSLVTYVDDYGRGDARVPVIRGAVFPLRESVTNRDVEEALQALAAAGCIRLYEAEGCPYLCFPEWEKHQNVRNKRSRYPAPPEEEEGVCLSPQASACNCAQASANAPVIQSESLSESESESENESGRGTPGSPPCGRACVPCGLSGGALEAGALLSADPEGRGGLLQRGGPCGGRRPVHGLLREQRLARGPQSHALLAGGGALLGPERLRGDGEA